MSHGKFTKAYLPAREGKVTVTGPFDPDDDDVKFAKIFFLVVQARRHGQAQDTVVVSGDGTWIRDPGGKETEWSGECPRSGDRALGPSTRELEVGPDVITRGIALSIVAQRGRAEDGEFDPPSIEALNWCADLEIVDGDPPGTSTAT